MKNIGRIFIISLIVAVLIGLPTTSISQANLRQPTVYSTSLLNLTWTAGTVNNGGKAVAIVTGSTNATASKTDCSAPAYASCNFLYADSSGTVAATTSVFTANAPGNTLLAYAQTNGTVITKLAFPNQASTATQIRLIQNCGTTVTCANTSAGPGIIEVFGSAALSSASPSTASLTALPFTSSSSYICTATPVGTTAAIAAAGLAINQTSGSAATVTGPNTVTTTFNYRCTGI